MKDLPAGGECVGGYSLPEGSPEVDGRVLDTSFALRDDSAYLLQVNLV